MTRPDRSRPATGTRSATLAGTAAMALLVGTFGVWSATTPLAGAVVAQGRIVVEGRAQSVQHRDGGIIAGLLVENGESVAAGDLLIRLDPTEAAASLDIARDRLSQATARRARLLAERSGAAEMIVGNGDRDLPGFADRLARQDEIRAARAAALATRRDRLTQTLARHDLDRAGLAAQIAALSEEIGYLDEEIGATEGLRASGLSTRGALAGLKRDRAARDGRRAALSSEAAQIDLARRDAHLETEAAETAFRETVSTELADVEAEIAELKVEIARLDARLERMDIFAPVSGLVHELAVNTIGGVIERGETILEIVPQDRGAAVEVRIDPGAIDSVRTGQGAELVFSALGRDTPPRLAGEIATVSAAAIPDPATGADFYRAEISVAPEAFSGIGLVPVPGQPVEVYLTTGTRTVLSYLVEPVAAHLRRTFRE